ncbi:lipoyl(octanoyl) transferase LipB [Buchnera aphidicola (Takecallis taiwana)]|uniref:lipoyl(octanoyl) transferase LipB n=1 Tax=Buchnera aphidicola TaxID=9 RepID=UPI0031B6A36D
MNIFNSNFKKPYIIIKFLPKSSWQDVFHRMCEFTNLRTKNTIDEIWFVEHDPIYTQGLIRHNNIKCINNIPVVCTNRGGKITYHGPGQQIVYLLLNLKRLNMHIRKLLLLIEHVVLNTLYTLKIIGSSKKSGIFVEHKKICSIGLRIIKYYSLHGFALNVKMDLTPFQYIHPCGDSTIIMTQICQIKHNISMNEVKNILIKNFYSFFNIKLI